MQRGMQRMNQNQKPGGRRSRTGMLAAKLVSLLLSGALGGYVGLLQSERKRRRRAKAK